jgi:hypothetical protein
LTDPIPLRSSTTTATQDRPTVRVIDDIRVITASERMLLLSRRQALLIELGSIEDYLDMERSVIPKHRRDEGGR